MHPDLQAYMHTLLGAIFVTTALYMLVFPEHSLPLRVFILSLEAQVSGLRPNFGTIVFQIVDSQMRDSQVKSSQDPKPVARVCSFLERDYQIVASPNWAPNRSLPEERDSAVGPPDPKSVPVIEFFEVVVLV